MKRRRRRKNEQAPLVWLWEFSKKVVTTAFLLYVLAFCYMLVTTYQAIRLTGDTAALSTFITEANETFRIVVGGYMLKAGGENIAKIVTSYLQKGRIDDEGGADQSDDGEKG